MLGFYDFESANICIEKPHVWGWRKGKMAELPSVWVWSRRCIIAWLEQRCLCSLGCINLLHSLPPGKKLAWLWKDYISSSCEECGKWINFWLNCFRAWRFPFHSLRQLLSSFKYLRYRSVVNAFETGLSSTICI